MRLTGELKNSGKSFISTDKDNIIIETVKPAENGDGMIVRLYDCENSLTKATLTFAEGMLESVEECNLMEEKEADIEACGNSFTVSVKPYEIKTYRVRLK